MKMQLMTLAMDNFKGFDHRVFDFQGKNAALCGDNATGKTTVYDALTWLLFGKDSQGRTGFEIKPLFTQGEHQGEVKDHAAVTSVEAALLVNGAECRLKRTLRESWTKKRGSSEASFDGHVSEYYVNDVPVKKAEFSARVGEIIDEDRFRLLTSISYFASTLPWQKRREVLFDLAGVGDDREIMATDQRFHVLAKAMGAYELDDYKKMLAAKRKRLNGTRTDIPARLDELNKTAEELSKLDFSALEREREGAKNARDALRAEIEASYRDSEADKLSEEITAATGELQKLEAANIAHRQSQKKPDSSAEEAGLQSSIHILTTTQERRKRDLAFLRERVKGLECEIGESRAQWNRIDAEEFQGAFCPTCGQKLPQARLEAAMSKFERDKDDRKARVVAEADRAKQRRQEAINDIYSMERSEKEDAGKLEELRARLKQLSNTQAEAPEIADLPNYGADRAGLEHQIDDLKARLESRNSAAALRRKGLHEDLNRCESEIDRLWVELSKRNTLDTARERMEELRGKAAAAAAELEELDRLLDLVVDFTRYKVKFVEESINRRFDLVRFRLFREQINGGVEDCCDVTVNGVPYDGGLNNGARINAGVDIINALSRHYDAYVPLFVDNAESVTKLERAGTQVIRLVVSEQDKELRCELQ